MFAPVYSCRHRISTCDVRRGNREIKKEQSFEMSAWFDSSHVTHWLFYLQIEFLTVKIRVYEWIWGPFSLIYGLIRSDGYNNSDRICHRFKSIGLLKHWKWLIVIIPSSCGDHSNRKRPRFIQPGCWLSKRTASAEGGLTLTCSITTKHITPKLIINNYNRKFYELLISRF